MVSNMPNTDIFKELYSKYLNKEKNYHKILENIEKEKKGINKYLKWSFIPICLIIVIACIMVFRNNNNSLLLIEKEVTESYIDDNIILNINNVTKEKELSKIDSELREISNYYDIPYYEVLSHLEVPEDFDDKEYINVISVKSNQNNFNDSINIRDEYLIQYQKILKNSSNNRSIIISYSEKNTYLLDYSSVEGKVSKINDFELIIYKYENSYMTKFNYKNIHISIETSDITEEEFVSLLLSIIK